MEPVDDLSFEPSDPPAPPSPPRRDTQTAVVVGLAILVLAGSLGWFMWGRARPATPPAGAQPGAAASGEARGGRTPLGPAVEPTPLPALDLSDPLVRDLLGRLSSHPQVAAWLAGSDLIRRFVVSLDNVATGATPARHLPTLAPKEGFQAVRRGDSIAVDPRTYERYNGVADSLTSLDPADLARLYATLKPRLVDAYRELGHPDGDIDAAVEQALVRLLATPVPRRRSNSRRRRCPTSSPTRSSRASAPPRSNCCEWGHATESAVQRQLWALGRELGIPAERLPAPQ